jgi:signal peptidase II
MRLKRLWLITIIIVILDQLTKTILTNKSYSILGLEIINYTENTGAAFSILEGYRWLFIIVAIASLIVLFYYSRSIKENEKTLQIPMGLLVGGMIGNLIDRILLGYVRDFIDLKIWAVFNIADSAVFVAVIILSIYFIKEAFSKTTYR